MSICAFDANRLGNDMKAATSISPVYALPTSQPKALEPDGQEPSSECKVRLADESFIPFLRRRTPMAKLAYASILFALMTSVASAQAPQQAPQPQSPAGPTAQIM